MKIKITADKHSKNVHTHSLGLYVPKNDNYVRLIIEEINQKNNDLSVTIKDNCLCVNTVRMATDTEWDILQAVLWVYRKVKDYLESYPEINTIMEG